MTLQSQISNSHNLLQKIKNHQTPPGKITVWALGQMGFLFKDANQQCILIDPVLSDVVAVRTNRPGIFKRAFPPPLDPQKLDFIQAVLVTHAHLDHCDRITLSALLQVNPGLVLIGPKEARDFMAAEGRINSNQWVVPRIGEVVYTGSLTLRSIPAAHYAVEIDAENSSRYLSFHLAWPGCALFHSGDTVIYHGYAQAIQECPPIDAAILALNGRDPCREDQDILGNLFPEEAAALAEQCGWKTIIAGHNDLFPYNTLPPARIRAVGEIFPRSPKMILPQIGTPMTFPEEETAAG